MIFIFFFPPSCAILSYYVFWGLYLFRTDLCNGKAENALCKNIGKMLKIWKQIQDFLFLDSCIFSSNFLEFHSGHF